MKNIGKIQKAGTVERQPHGGGLYRPAKGETANPRGRPRKFVSQLRDTGYAMSEVNDCIRVLLAMTEAELGAVSGNPDATVLEKTIAAALIKGIERGSLDPIECLLSRTYGRPRESADMRTTPGEITIHRVVMGNPHAARAIPQGDNGDLTPAER